MRRGPDKEVVTKKGAAGVWPARLQEAEDCTACLQHRAYPYEVSAYCYDPRTTTVSERSTRKLSRLWCSVVMCIAVTNNQRW